MFLLVKNFKNYLIFLYSFIYAFIKLKLKRKIFNIKEFVEGFFNYINIKLYLEKYNYKMKLVYI